MDGAINYETDRANLVIQSWKTIRTFCALKILHSAAFCTFLCSNQENASDNLVIDRAAWTSAGFLKLITSVEIIDRDKAVQSGVSVVAEFEITDRNSFVKEEFKVNTKLCCWYLHTLAMKVLELVAFQFFRCRWKIVLICLTLPLVLRNLQKSKIPFFSHSKRPSIDIISTNTRTCSDGYKY